MESEERDAVAELEAATAEDELNLLVERFRSGEDVGVALAAAKRRTLAAMERLAKILKDRLATVESQIVALRLDGTTPA